MCDGKWDCPFGKDEQLNPTCNLSLISCVEMYRCSGRRFQCVPLITVCDGRADCWSEDDEVFCEERDCPSTCVCHLFAIVCQTPLEGASSKTYQFLYVSLQGNTFSSLEEFGTNVKFLKLLNSSFLELCRKFNEKTFLIVTIEISESQIGHGLFRYCFSSAFYLKQVALTNDNLTFIQSSAFVKLEHLVLVNVLENPIISLSENTIQLCPNLLVLQMSFSTEKAQFDISLQALENVELQIFVSNESQMCCLISGLFSCLNEASEINEFYSCSNLLPHNFKQLCTADTFSLVSISGISIGLHIVARKSLHMAFVYSVIFYHISAAPIIGHLSLFWFSEHYYGTSFFANQFYWMTSVTCFVLYGMIVCFTLKNCAFMLFLSISRCMVVVCPLDSRFKSGKFVLKCLFGIQTSTLVISISLASAYAFVAEKGHSIFCAPTVYLTESSLAGKVIFWTIFVIRIGTAVSILIFHCVLTRGLISGQKALQKSHGENLKQNFAIILQLCVLTLNTIGFSAAESTVSLEVSERSKQSLELERWLAFLVLPLRPFIGSSVLFLFGLKKCLQNLCGTKVGTQNQRSEQ